MAHRRFIPGADLDPWAEPSSPCLHEHTYLRHYPASGGYSSSGESITTPAHDAVMCSDCGKMLKSGIPCDDAAKHYHKP